MAPGSDAMSGVYLLTLQVLEQDFPFQVTIKPDDFEIEAFHQIIKTSEVESWQFSIPEEILANYTLTIKPSSNPL